MTLNRVIIVNKTYPKAGLDFLKENGLDATVLPILDHYPESLVEIKKNLPGYDALIWNTKHRLTPELLELAGSKLKAVSTMASGTDHIDISALKQRGIFVGNTLRVLDEAVADIAVGLLIGAARNFKEGIRTMETGTWKYGVQWLLGQDIAGSTVGIVGFGGIGQAIVRRLNGFGVAKFIYCGRTEKPEAKELNTERVPLEELLKESDFVILACPLTDETRNLINKDTLDIMKRNSVVVNIGRGGLIDQTALYEALKSRRIFAAGLDVTTPEPIPKDHPLLTLDNCFITPHLGSATIQTRDKMAVLAAQNIVLALTGKPMMYPC